MNEIHVGSAIAALDEHGPMTAAELAGLFECDRRDASRAIHGARRGKVKRIYIARWNFEAVEGMREYLRPVYAAGSKRDAKRPAPIHPRLAVRRYKQRQKARRTVPAVLINSIFALASCSKI